MYKAVLADDEPKICQLILELGDWKRFGIEVAAVCKDGEEAFESICRIRPDIVLTDIRMPVYDGLELIRRVTEAGLHPAFIIISGYKYFETVDRDAFEGADMSDVCFKYNHGDVAMILARTRNKTLVLAADDHGLSIQADIAETSTGKDVYELIRRGDLDKMSFAFTVEKEQVDYDEKAKTCTRNILKFDKIFDVSAVDVPAYDGTEISTVEGRSAEYFRKVFVSVCGISPQKWKKNYQNKE